MSPQRSFVNVIHNPCRPCKHSEDWISGFQSGFPDFRVVSGFQSGFLDFRVDFWISLDFWISDWISADTVRDFFRGGPLGVKLIVAISAFIT